MKFGGCSKLFLVCVVLRLPCGPELPRHPIVRGGGGGGLAVLWGDGALSAAARWVKVLCWPQVPRTSIPDSLNLSPIRLIPIIKTIQTLKISLWNPSVSYL